MRRKLKHLSIVLTAATTFLSAQSPQTPSAAAAPTIKTSAQIVILDVVVTDKNKKPVHNLKPTDFDVLDSGASQTISHFEEHIYPNPKVPSAVPGAPSPSGVATASAPNQPSDTLNIILLDSLNTTLAQQANVRTELKEYLSKAKPGIPTAIFGLTRHLILLQGFNSNPEVLKSIVNKKKLDTSPLLDDNIGDSPSKTDMVNDLMTITGEDQTPTVAANMIELEAGYQASQLTLRVHYTLDALNLLARTLSGIPGRKNLIWLSGSFPLNVWQDPTLQNPFASIANYDDELRETNRLLTAAQVAVYPVNARGLYNDPLFDVSNSATKSRPLSNGQNMGTAEDKLFQQTAAENATMGQMAEQTGGRAFTNVSSLSDAVESAVANGTNFYTLTYSPTNQAQDGKFRKLEVKLQQKGYNLAYRRGYYAVAASNSSKNKKQ